MGKLRFCKDYSILSKTTTKDMYGRENVEFVENGSIKGYLYNSVSYRDIQAYGDLAKSTYKIMSEQKAEIYSNGNKQVYETSSATFSVGDYIKIDGLLYIIINIINSPKLLTLDLRGVSDVED